MRKKPKTKKKPRSSKKLPPIKREQDPEPDMHPEDAFLREWTKRVLED